jgi:aminoglycoside phosphotransferase family enzyme/predicted kinase
MWAGLGGSAAPAPARAEAIDVRETHGAVLGFAGDRVLKIKRPVDLGFFDFRDPERRRFFCSEEVRLNRRLAPAVYLGVAPVVERDGRLVTSAPREPAESVPTGTALDGGTVVDHAVAMVRLPDDGMLSHRLATGRVTDADLGRIARRIARFHAAARRDARVDELASPPMVRREFAENAEQLAERLGDAECAAACAPDRVRRVRRWLDRTLADATPTLEARVAAGRACEGHGDLHGGNICLLGEAEDDVVAFDCVEFEEAYRCGDVAREMGFLAMDLEARGDAAAADTLLAAYAAAAEDPEVPQLVAPFLVHYALVRAKVAAITAGDLAAGSDGRRRLLAELRRYGEIAVVRALPPAVVLTCGLPGTGKSRLGGAIAARLGAEMICSDVERKRLFGIEPTDRTPEARRAEVYGADATRRTYDRLTEGAVAAIRDGRSVVLDATYSRAAERSRTIAAIEAAGAEWLLVHADPSPETVRRWLAGRAGDPANVSDADLAVSERGRASFEPPDELAAERVLRFGDPPAGGDGDGDGGGEGDREGPRRVIAALEALAAD